ncbi:nucleoside diphosphate kinase [Niallia sp. NCCP-28]|nr:nucleoside diphosphate kinase [Niallia sp. NCCP-28]
MLFILLRGDHMTLQRTFIMVKPDGVKRGLIGEIIKRFEQKGFSLLHAELMSVNRTKAEYHYMEHQNKPFFGELVDFITSGPVFAMVWEGENIIEVSRLMIGKTSPSEAMPGTIRGDFAAKKEENVIHGSDSLLSAEREIENFFGLLKRRNLEDDFPFEGRQSV